MSDAPPTASKPREAKRLDRQRSPNVHNGRSALAIVLAAAGAAGLYYSQWLLVGLLPAADEAFRLAAFSLWPSSVTMLIAAVLLTPPGRMRIYVRAAFLLLVAVSVLMQILVIDYPFPAEMAWW